MRQDIHNSDVPEICRSCEARHKGVCGALNPAQLAALAKQTTRREITEGTELIAADEPVASYSNIMSGVVKLSKLLADGRQQIVGLQFAPDFLGRPLKADSRIAAEAATTVRLCSFPKTTLERMMKEAPGLEHKLLEQALNELDEARDWMVTLGRKSAREKIASFLYLIAVHIDPEVDDLTDGGCSFDLPLTRADIADFLGLTIETVSRQLTKLRQQNIITIANNRHITVPDINLLRECCEG
ncbi:MAG: Crp/Fnr family transcriptional regulator [Rhizobiales bacterium]|nr:Crp/Fnr family transcriptional regulator [Hyphomicrobiales bacterium]